MLTRACGLSTNLIMREPRRCSLRFLSGIGVELANGVNQTDRAEFVSLWKRRGIALAGLNECRSTCRLHFRKRLLRGYLRKSSQGPRGIPPFAHFGALRAKSSTKKQNDEKIRAKFQFAQSFIINRELNHRPS